MAGQSQDKDGRVVKIGSKIKILSISEDFLRNLPAEEVLELESMINEIHEIIEIEKWGGVWGEKEFPGDSEDQISFHKICLEPEEFEKIE